MPMPDSMLDHRSCHFVLIASRYFLITPKLLTGLRYHQKMKVLIINNGVYRESHVLSISFAADDCSSQRD